MTKQEAIEALTSKDVCNSEMMLEALDMAIEALEQERSRLAQITQYRNDCEKLMQENEQLKKALEKDSCDDCISREKVNEILEYYYDKDSDGYKQAFKSIVEDLESVKPQITTDTITEYCKEHNYILCEKGTERDAISRHDVECIVEELENICHNAPQEVLELLAKLKNAPFATPYPKTGHWVEENTNEGGRKVFCSECGCPPPFEHISSGDVYSASGYGVINKTNYCPNCGARMESEDNE